MEPQNVAPTIIMIVLLLTGAALAITAPLTTAEGLTGLFMMVGACIGFVLQILLHHDRYGDVE